MAARDILIKIGAQNKASKVLKTVRKDVVGLGGAGKALQSQLLKLGGAAAGLFTLQRALSGVVGEMQAIDQTAKKARQLGILSDDLVAIRLASEELAGVGASTVDMALQRMTRRLSEAAAGTGEAKAAIEELGLSAQKLNQMGPGQAFRAIADAIKDVKNPTDQLRIAFKLFDSEGAQLINTLNAGGAAIDAYQKKAERLGLTFSDDVAKNVELANDRIAEMTSRLKGLGRQAAATAAGPISTLIESIQGGAEGRTATERLINNIQDFWKRNNEGAAEFIKRANELDAAMREATKEAMAADRQRQTQQRQAGQLEAGKQAAQQFGKGFMQGITGAAGALGGVGGGLGALGNSLVKQITPAGTLAGRQFSASFMSAWRRSGGLGAMMNRFSRGAFAPPLMQMFNAVRNVGGGQALGGGGLMTGPLQAASGRLLQRGPGGNAAIQAQQAAVKQMNKLNQQLQQVIQGPNVNVKVVNQPAQQVVMRAVP